jgi:hypothetical protein
MSDLGFTMMLIGVFLVVAMILRATELRLRRTDRLEKEHQDSDTL